MARKQKTSSSKGGPSGAAFLVWLLLIIVVFESFILFKIYSKHPEIIRQNLPAFLTSLKKERPKTKLKPGAKKKTAEKKAPRTEAAEKVESHPVTIPAAKISYKPGHGKI